MELPLPSDDEGSSIVIDPRALSMMVQDDDDANTNAGGTSTKTPARQPQPRPLPSLECPDWY